MLGLIQYISGIKVIENPMLPEFTVFSKRKHEMTTKTFYPKYKVYHLRIQKKWDKRFGTKQERFILRTGDCLVAHPSTVKFIVKALPVFKNG